MSGYNYAENDPVGYVDLWGLQRAISIIQIARNSSGELFQNSSNTMERPGQGVSNSHFYMYGNQELYGSYGHLTIVENLETGAILKHYEPDYYTGLGLIEKGTPQKGGIEILGYAGDGSWDGAAQGYAQSILDFAEFFTGGQSAGYGQGLIRRGQVAEKIGESWYRFISPETVSAMRTFVEYTKGVKHGINAVEQIQPSRNSTKIEPWTGKKRMETDSGIWNFQYNREGTETGRTFNRDN